MRIFLILFFTVFILFKNTSQAETVEDLVQQLNDIQEEIKSLSSSDSDEAKIIDQSIEEINKATNFALEKIASDDLESAKSALAYSSKSIGDVGKVVPKEFESDMSNADIENFASEKMATLKVVTTAMAKKKQEDNNLLLDQIIDLNEAGFNTTAMSGNLASLGIDTVTMIELDNRKFAKIKNKIIENQIEISKKQENIKQLENQMDPLESQIRSFESQKQEITDKYNADLVLKTTEGKVLTEKYNTNIAKITDEMSKTQNQSSELSTKISSIKNDLNTNYNNVDSLTNDISTLENELSDSLTKATVKQEELSKLKSSITNLDGQVNNLTTSKASLTTKYNAELTKQASLTISPPDLAKSKDLSNQINKEIEDISTKISNTQQQSLEINSQIENLNIQIKNENLISDELNQKVANFNDQLKENSLLEKNKQAQIINLKSSLPELEKQAENLNAQKISLSEKYNQELAKQAELNISEEDLAKSKSLTDNINNEINGISNKITEVENSSNSVSIQISSLTNQIKTNTLETNGINREISSLNKELQSKTNLVSSKQVELENLQSIYSNKDSEISKLNKQIENVSLQGDFIQADIEKLIDKEIEAVEYFFPLINKMSEKEIDFAMEEVGVLLDGDPRKANAFEFRKYGTYAGLSEAEIQQSINAVYSDDWATQKNVLNKVIQKLSQDPNWSVDIPTDAEVNVMVAESKALLAAVEIIKKGDQIKQQIDAIINEKTKPYQQISGLNKTNLQYAVLYEGSLGAELVNKEFDKIVNNDLDLISLRETLEEKQQQLSEIQILQDLKNQEITKAIKPLQGQLPAIYDQMNSINQVYNQKQLEKVSYINSIGGYASLYRDKGNANYGDWVKNVAQFDQKLFDINKNAQDKMIEAQNISSEIYKIQIDNTTPASQLNTWTNLQREVGTLSMEKVIKEGNIAKQARTNVIALVDDAKSNIQKITSEEISKNPDYNYVEKVNKILDQIPTLSSEQRKRANEAITGLDHTSLIGGYYPVDVGNKAAALRAALDGDVNTYEAYMTAVDKVKDIGKEGSYKGPYWEMTNVKLALVVKSTMEGNMGYVNTSENERIQLTSAEKASLGKEFNQFFPSQKLANTEKELEALNEKLSKLKMSVNTTPEQINELNNQIKEAQNGKKTLEVRISDLNNDLTAKTEFINTSQKTLTTLENQLSPINSELTSLKTEKTNLSLKMDDQISKLSKNLETSAKVNAETVALKEQYNQELSAISEKIDSYASKSSETSKTIDFLNTELSGIKNTNSSLQGEISTLNEAISQNQINVTNKQSSLAALQGELAPLNNEIQELNNSKQSLDVKLNSQIDLISTELELQGTVSPEAQVLKDKYEKEVQDLDIQIASVQKESNSLKTSIESLSSEISSIKTNEQQFSSEINELNQQLEINKNIINDKKNSLIDFESQFALSTSNIINLNNSKKNLSEKLEAQAIKVAKELENKGEISQENLELKQTFENQLAALDKKITTFKIESKAIDTTMSAINLELSSLEEIQKITAIKAKELAPDSVLSIQFNYENTQISKDAARVGAVSLGKSDTEWANSWKGNIETTKIVNGSVVQLSEDEIQSVKADLAMESVMQSLATGNISKNLAIDPSELKFASALSADVMMETLQQQTKYLSYAVSEGMHEMTTESAMAGVKSLGKSQADWAAAWTGGDPTSKNINGINIALTAEEIQATKAEWAMNRAAQSIMSGETFTDGSLTIDSSAIQEATANATQQAMADVQEKAANIASQVASIAESVQNMQQGIADEVGEELAQTISDVVAENASLASNVAERAIQSVAELEDYLDIDVEALTSDTSSWTNADWAASWTGDEPGNDPGLGRDYTQAEKDAIKADWAKNRAEQYGN